MKTYIALDVLPDGRERVLAEDLTLAQLLNYTGPPAIWALSFRLVTR